MKTLLLSFGLGLLVTAVLWARDHLRVVRIPDSAAIHLMSHSTFEGDWFELECIDPPTIPKYCGIKGCPGKTALIIR
jgi:hypothetical protein